MTTGWLSCKIQPGMFSTEMLAEVQTVDGRSFRFFVPVEAVRDNQVKVRVRNGGRRYFVTLPTDYPHGVLEVKEGDLVAA